MFSQEKVLQEILFLLRLNGGKLELTKLMKELYLIDRESMGERESSVSGDEFFFLRHGPVLSFTLNILETLEESEWGDFLERKGNTFLPKSSKSSSDDFDLLSEKEKAYIKKISEQFREKPASDLVNYVLTLKECSPFKKPGQRIQFSELMSALGKTDREIRQAKAENDFFEKLVRNCPC